MNGGYVTHPVGRAKRLLVAIGFIVPVEEADEAEDESSLVWSTGNSVKPSVSSSSSSANGSGGNAGGKPPSLAFANDL